MASGITPPAPAPILHLIEAFVLFFFARTVLLLAPFRRIAPSLGRICQHEELAAQPLTETATATVLSVSQAVRSAARWAFFRAVCLDQAIAAQLVLKRRKQIGVVHFGVEADSQTPQKMTAHAWVDIAGIRVTGYPRSPKLVEVCAFSD